MSSDTENFWQAVDRVEKTGGAFSAFVFVIIFAGLYVGLAFLVAWSLAATFGTPYWMTFLTTVLVKIYLS